MRIVSSALVVCGLCACGGGGTSGTSTGTGTAAISLPEIDGVASAGAVIGQSFESTGPSASIGQLVVTGGFFASASGSTETVTVATTPDDDIIEVTIGASGQPTTLTRNAQNDVYEAFTQSLGDSQALSAVFALSDEAGLMLLIDETVVGNVAGATGSFHAFGNTVTSTAPLSGSSVYVGAASYVATGQGNGGSYGGSGGFIFEADFDSNDISGAIALSDFDGTQFLLGFADENIGNTGFSVGALETEGLSGTVTSSGLNGDFFGADGDQVAGTFSVARDITSFGNGTAPDVFIAGGFIGNSQNQATIDALTSGQPVNVGNGEQVILGSGIIGGSGSVYPNGASSYYNSNTGAGFGSDGGGCFYSGNWSNC